MIVEDNLGYSSAADPFILTISTARPPAPTATPVPTATPSPIVEVGEQVLATDRDLLLQLLIGMGLVGILLFLVRWWRFLRGRRATALRRSLADDAERAA